MTNTDIVNKMLENAVHFGHKTSKWNPKMKKYIYGEKFGVHVFDLFKTAELLKQAQNFLQTCASEKKTVLLVSTKQQAKKIIEETAKALNMPYISERWIGGFLTNFDTIKKRIKFLNELKEQEQTGELEKYTKKEAMQRKKQKEKMESILGGVIDLKKIPDAIFVLDAVRDKIAVKEAQSMNIPIVAIVDSNADPKGIDYPIPGNDDALKAIQIVKDSMQSGK